MKLTYLILTFICSIGYAQEFIPLDTTSYEHRINLKEDYQQRFEVYNKIISQQYSGKLKKELLAVLKERQEEVIKLFTDNTLLFDTAFNNFLEESIDSVKITNPALNENYNVLLSKSPSPNAYSIGYNTIVINIGLFKYLGNEHQLRSVLLHELAHEIKAHSMLSQFEIAKTNLSSKSKKELEEINQVKYNKGGLAFKKLKEILMDKSSKSRHQELQADSLGFEIFNKTSWPNTTFINALTQIKALKDAPDAVLDTTIYERLFHLKDLPFNKDWLNKEDFSSYNYSHYKEKINLDSIASHPELDIRIEQLKSKLPKLTNYDFLKPSEEFMALQYQASLQQVANLFDLKEYGASLYSCLILLESYPEMPYLFKYLGLNFNEIHNAQKEYKLNRYVDQLNPNEQSESYNLFLNFIWNLRLKEMKAIADYYMLNQSNN